MWRSCKFSVEFAGSGSAYAIEIMIRDWGSMHGMVRLGDAPQQDHRVAQRLFNRPGPACRTPSLLLNNRHPPRLQPQHFIPLHGRSRQQ